MKRNKFKKHQEGFSLIELMISIVILLIVSGSSFTALNYYQKNYIGTQLRVDMHAGMRAALELMSQEIGQAGMLGFTPRTLASAITSSTAAQSVTLSSTTDIFVGEKLLIDTGDFQETVSVTAISGSTVTGIFGKDHASGARVNAVGIFPQGIMWPSSTATRLRLYGDLYGDGTLVFAQYDCVPAVGSTPGTFSRSVTPITAANISASSVLISNVIANPGGTACFRYTTRIISGSVFVVSVGITVSVQTTQRDPQTNAFVTMTKSFLNISPRNILAGVEDAQNSVISRLQPTPPNLPLLP